METRRRTFTNLGAAALVFAILAGIVLWQRAAEGLARYTPATFLPGFADKAKDAARIPGLDIGVDEASGWEFDGRKVAVLEVPAHTRGAITFVIDGNAFTGDTLFTLGCGRLFEGDAAMMWASLSKLMQLPDDTKIWCGHEYTQSNGRFALSIEPGNAALVARMKDVDAARARGQATVPSTLGLEKQTNPFLRPDSAEIRKSLGLETASDVAVFGEIRERKNNF